MELDKMAQELLDIETAEGLKAMEDESLRDYLIRSIQYQMDVKILEDMGSKLEVKGFNNDMELGLALKDMAEGIRESIDEEIVKEFLGEE